MVNIKPLAINVRGLFCAQMEEKGAFLKGTLRFSCFVASFKKGVTLRFADYILLVT